MFEQINRKYSQFQVNDYERTNLVLIPIAFQGIMEKLNCPFGHMENLFS